MRIRAVEAGDAVAWAAMRQALWPAPAGEHVSEITAFFSGPVTRPAAAFMAVDRTGPAAGFAEVAIRDYAENCYSGRVAFLEGLYVVPAQRRRGIARKLIRAVEDWARDQGLTEMASDTALDNTAGQALHRAAGFDEVNSIVCYRKAL